MKEKEEMRRQAKNSALESIVQFVFLNIGVIMKAKSWPELNLQIICCTYKL